MKKILLGLMLICFIFVLAGCDYELTPKPTEEEPPVETEVIPKTPSSNIESFDRLFNDEVFKRIIIKISKQSWDRLDNQMITYHQQYGNYRTDVYARADMIFEDNLGSVEIKDIGFRTRGNLSRVRIQNSDGSLNLSHFKISFKEDFGLSELIDNQNRTAFEIEEIDMKFNRNQDSTYLTEKYAMDLFQAFDVYAATTTLAQLIIEIDGTPYVYGIYTLFEPIDKLFFERRLPKNEADGDLYKSLWQQFGPASLLDNYPDRAIGIKDASKNYRPAYDLKNNKKTSDHSALKSFITQINQLNGEAFKTYIEANLDVDMFLRYLAVGVLLGNPDDYRSNGNNYFLFQNDVTKKWMMLPYDYDHGLGQGWNGAPVFENWSVNQDIYRWGNYSAHALGRSNPNILSDKILSIRSYQEQYELYLAELISQPHLFNHQAFLHLYESQKAIYEDYTQDSHFNQPPFGLRNTLWYFQSKQNSVSSQIQYYQTHPNMRSVY
jgi:spore coat protein H